MANVFADRILVSIDIGTTKICVLIAQRLDDKQLEVIGIGKALSEGLQKGVVINIGQTVCSIKRAIKEAEIMAGLTIESAYIGISGGHIHAINSSGAVPIKYGEVRPADITNVIEAAKAIPIPEGQHILHVLPQFFVIDSQDKIQEPLGMHGIRLEVQTHIIMGSIASVQNLVKCCEMAGIKVIDIILEQLASADAVLSYDERELGVAMLDIGGGTSDLALYQHGSIKHTMVLPIAGNHFTNDIAVGLHATLHDAERIKRELGTTCIDKAHDEIIEAEMVQGNQKNKVHVKDLVAIIKPRAEELLSLVYKEIVDRKLQSFVPSGLVLTGGGSLLGGLDETATKIFSMSVRLGVPKIAYNVPPLLNSPIYATGYGLLIYALKKEQRRLFNTLDGPLVKRVFMQMKSWVSDFF